MAAAGVVHQRVCAPRCRAVLADDRGAADHAGGAADPGAAAAGGAAAGPLAGAARLLPVGVAQFRGADHAVGWSDSQPTRGAGGQRARVLAGCVRHRRGVARIVCGARRSDQLAGSRCAGPPDAGHPDRAGQPAAATGGGRRDRGPAARRAQRGGVSGGHHLVRAHPGAVLSGDVSGRHRREPAGAAAAADLPPRRRVVLDTARLRRRRHAAVVDAPAGHRPAHGGAGGYRVAAAPGRRPARPGVALSARGAVSRP